MCGLVGVVNKYGNGLYKQQQEVFNTLLFIDYLRGTDSTGVFAVHSGGDVMVAKEASNPIDFMESDAYEAIMKRTLSKGHALIGHNRKATRGNVNDENAHPFVVDNNIVLVHNGTMFGDHKKIADVEVDSHAIAHAIHEKGDVKEALSSFDAAYALIWYDVEKQTLNFIRNSQRPLWFMETHSSIIWASEKCMLKFAAAKHNLTLTSQPMELTEDMHQMLTLKSGGTWDVNAAEKIEFEKKKVVYAGEHEFFPTRGNRHPYANGYYDGWDADDVPFAHVVAAATAAAEHKETKPVQVETKRNVLLLEDIERQLPRLNSRREQPLPVLVSGPDPRKATDMFDFERMMCHKMNKTVPFGQWIAMTEADEFLQGKRVLAATFEYTYRNLKDDKNGFVLYSHLLDDEDIVVRHYFAPNMTNEERIMQIAGSNYIYSYVIGTKTWRPFVAAEASSPSREAPGYIIIEGESATLVDGGGMTNPEYKITH